MRIAFVGQDLFAQGAQHVEALLATGFINRGYDVDLVVSRLHRDYLEAGRTNMFSVPESARFVHLSYRHARQCIGELRRYIKQTRDLVAIISMGENYAKAVRLATIGMKQIPKLVYVEHGVVGYDDVGNRKETPRKHSIGALLRSLLWKTYYRILTVSQMGVEDFIRMNPGLDERKVICVNNPCIGDAFYRKISAPTTHPWLKEPGGKWKTFVCAGSFNEYKGHKYLLEAMNIIAKKHVNVRVVLFGQGPLEVDYRKYIAENNLEDYVSIGGYIENFPAEAKSAYGFVLSSTAESFGLVLVEALACGCQIVATDPPFGPREILENGKYGLLVPPANATALADGIIAAAQKPQSAIPDEAWRNYTIDAAIDRYAVALSLPKSLANA